MKHKIKNSTKMTKKLLLEIYEYFLYIIYYIIKSITDTIALHVVCQFKKPCWPPKKNLVHIQSSTSEVFFEATLLRSWQRQRWTCSLQHHWHCSYYTVALFLPPLIMVCNGVIRNFDPQFIIFGQVSNVQQG